IRSGLETVRSSLASLADVADQATTLSLRAFNTLSADSMCMVDTACQSALSDIGTCYGLMSGRDPRTGEQAAEAKAKGYKGMGSSLREILAGVGKSQGGLDQVSTGLDRLATGAGKLADGLEAASPAVKELRSGVGRMLGGLEQIIPGLDQLRDGLASGAVKIRASGIVSAPTAGQDFSLTPALVNAVPKLKEQLGYFVGEDGRWTRMYVSLAEDAYSTRSLDAIGEIRSLAKLSLARTPLAGSEVLVTGTSAYFDDIRRVSGEDTKLIVAVVIIGVFIVLALLLRSLVAPAYLVATVLLSLMSTLGLTTLVFQGLLHRSGISWFIPTFLFVILVALGADYNIFLMSRIREEAGRSVTSVAVGEGLRFTGHVITSAGLILAGTFAALMAASLKSLAEMGFAVTVGVLLDTFIVRSLLVPSLAVLLGRHNWWPSSRSRSA
ncbi:MAG: MMPL family transporter, partial [Actinomycetota bacterium]